ncbi:MAG: hypothetical protein HYY84_10570 [Deltaproteobacteria bacterium]|nr:hypothetical protein [Deltaproteobacteria bacterium]
MRRITYDLLSIIAFGAAIYAFFYAVRRLAASDYVAAMLAIVAGLIILVASSELFRYAISIWITETRREK